MDTKLWTQSCGQKVVDTTLRKNLRTNLRTNSWTHADTCGQTCGHTRAKVVDTHGQVADKVVDTCGQACGHTRTKLWTHADKLRTKLWTHADKLVDTRTKLWTHADKLRDKAVATCGQTCGCMRTKLRMHSGQLGSGPCVSDAKH